MNNVTINTTMWEGDPLNVGFYPIDQAPEHKPKYSVIMARYKEQWLYVRHRERTTWEIPGGHIEEGETPLEAAKRELQEETGAIRFDLTPVSVYYMSYRGEQTFGWLFVAEVHALGELPDMEIAEVKPCEGLADDLTYFLVQPHLYQRVVNYIKGE